MTDDSSDDDLAATRQNLYAADPDRFVAVRAELAGAARKTGDAALAKKIAALRKPTTSASIVNRHVLSDPTITTRLTAIGDRLRTAQNSPDGIDRDLLRELSTERRSLVRDVSDAALETFGPSSGSAIRDEVVSTFDAAVADPDVADRLGGLVRSEQWSGFGVVGDGPAPARAHVSRSTTAVRKAEADRSAAARELEAAARELEAAARELDEADRDLSSALDEQQAAKNRVGELEAQLADLQSRLAAAEHEVTAARDVVRAARVRRRKAASAHERASR